MDRVATYRAPLKELLSQHAERMNRRRTFALIEQLINDTTTQAGLIVCAHLVTTSYPSGVKVTDDEMDLLQIRTHTICPQWNYTISPRLNPDRS